MRHVEKPLGIAAAAAAPLSEIMRNATRGALHLIRSIGTVLAQLGNDGTQSTNQIQCNCVCDQHVLLDPQGFTKKQCLPADDLRSGASPVATDPRQEP